MDQNGLRDQLLLYVEQHGCKIAFKQESPFMRILGKLLFFNPAFMTQYTTTIGSTIYFPSREFLEKHPVNAAIVLAHEYQHVLDARTDGARVFAFRYLRPQIWALGAILGVLGLFWAPLYLLGILLLAGAPYPSEWRSHYEARGYSWNVISAVWLGLDPQKTLDACMNHFVDSTYYWMGESQEIQVDVKAKLRLAWSQAEDGSLCLLFPQATDLEQIFKANA